MSKLQLNRGSAIIKLLTLSAVVIFSVVAISNISNKKEVVESPLSSSQPSPTPKIVSKTANSSEIQKLLSSSVEKLHGNYCVVIKNLKTNEVYQLNQDKKIASASIYKLAVMYKAYDSLEKGELKKDQAIPGGFTVLEALNLMITVSHNGAALALAEKLGWTNIDNFIKSQGINGFNLVVKDYPETTAQGTAQLLEKIYRKNAVSKSASEEMIDLLLRQTLNDRIPRYLPKDIEVAHKTGELDNFRHDAGIVFGKKSDYIFVFLTETPIPQDSYENIAKLSKTLYEALERD